MEMTLRLPNNYVEIEEEEMMYLDAGYSTRQKLYGVDVIMSNEESVELQRNLGAFSANGGLLVGFAGVLSGGAFGAYGIFTLYAAAVKDSLARHTTSNGVTLSISAGFFWSRGR